MVNVDECIMIVKNVPSRVCEQCGDVTYSHDVAKRLENVLDSMESSLTEIAVTSYPHAAA